MPDTVADEQSIRFMVSGTTVIQVIATGRIILAMSEKNRTDGPTEEFSSRSRGNIVEGDLAFDGRVILYIIKGKGCLLVGKAFE